MNLGEIRQFTYLLLDDPQGTRFDVAAVNHWINFGYQMVVDQVDLSPHPWSVVDDDEATVVTPVSGTTRYDLGEGRSVAEVKEDPGSGKLIDVDVIPYAQRHQRGAGVFWYRKESNGRLALGICDEPTIYRELRVYVRPKLVPLTADATYPTAVPGDAHELIAVAAALSAKVVEERDTTGIAALWENSLSRLRLRLAAPQRSYTATRLIR